MEFGKWLKSFSKSQAGVEGGRPSEEAKVASVFLNSPACTWKEEAGAQGREQAPPEGPGPPSAQAESGWLGGRGRTGHGGRRARAGASWSFTPPLPGVGVRSLGQTWT